MWGLVIDGAGDLSWSWMLSSQSMPSASKEGTPRLLEGVVIEDRVKVRVDMVVVTRPDGWVGHKGVLVLTHTHFCLNSSSQHQLSDKRVVPSALVHRAVCDLENIHDQNCEFSIPLCVSIMVYFIGPSLHNSVVQCLCYVTNNWATCFDLTGPSSGL